MSYNGIGLQSVRGSATSGHVQTNLNSKISKPGFHESRKKEKQLQEHLQHQKIIDAKKRQSQERKSRHNDEDEDEEDEDEDEGIRKELIDHELLRRIEVKCMDLRDKLEDEDVEELVIDKKVSELRQKLMNEDKGNKNKEDKNEPQKMDDKKNENTNSYDYKRLYKEKNNTSGSRTGPRSRRIHQ